MIKHSRVATALAALAISAMAAPPAMARHGSGWGSWGGGWGGWGRHHRHRDRVDAGDVIAGVLIIGGIAAVAAAASNANKNKQRDRDYRYPERDDSQRERSSEGYANDERPQWNESTGIDGAIDRCRDEVARGSTRVEDVDSVNRDGDGWRVQGSTTGDGSFSCTIDADGRIRDVDINGRNA